MRNPLPRSCQREAEKLFSVEEQPKLRAYLIDVLARLNLTTKHTEQMLSDHLQALHYLTEHGLTLEAAMERLSSAQLSDFYLKERKEWYPLDHAAKIYPLSMSLKRMMVFRVSCYLKEPVVPAMLQMALTYTMKRFPYFATTIKCGFFWHYLDSATRRFAARPETKLPCSVMKLGSVASPSFRVIYYQNRISVEFFHILADGTGALIFLRTLLKTYLRLMGEEIPEFQDAFDIDGTPQPVEWSDDFPLCDKPNEVHGFADKPAMQMRGMLPYEQPNRVLHFNFSTEALLKQARSKGVTITALLLGYMLLACKDAAPSHTGKRKIQIQLPVNMRKFYPSTTLRNFSMYCGLRLLPSEVTTLDDILPEITRQVKAGTAKEALDQTMQLSRKLVRYLRFVPLIVKRPIAYLIYGFLGDGVFTSTLSNLGEVKTPPEMERYVDKFDFVLGPPIQNRAVCSLCSYHDKAVFTVVKNTTLTAFEDSLYRHFTENGLTPYMEGSD
ncbi:MAG: hypothetical protein PHI98_06875 [Eubacteriales bacterium]|nr:hypothetical protein [Eubacteriales bacterium]